jgi:hypothetical protein
VTCAKQAVAIQKNISCHDWDLRVLECLREKQDMQLQWISTKIQKPGVGMGLIDEN